MFRRWLKFNLVGVLGAAVQLFALHALSRWAGWNYLAATAVAVEIAIVHNFVWHEAFTWRGPGLPVDARARAMRFVQFNAYNGAVSLLGNVAIMWLLVGQFRWPRLLSNGVAICACALLNFYLGERHIFADRARL